MTGKINVIISDWQILVREGINFILSSEEDMIIAGKASGIEEAKQLIEDFPPDVAILDVRKNDLSGWDIIQGLRRDLPNVSFVFIMDIYDEDRIFTVIKSGANGCIFNDSTPAEVRKTVRVAGNKGFQISNFLLVQGIAVKTLAEFEKNADDNTYLSGLLARLTPREFDLMQHVKNNETVDNPERFLESIRVKLVNNQRYYDIYNAVKLHSAAIVRSDVDIENQNAQQEHGFNNESSAVNQHASVRQIDEETGRQSEPGGIVEGIDTAKQVLHQMDSEKRIQNTIEGNKNIISEILPGHFVTKEPSDERTITEKAGDCRADSGRGEVESNDVMAESFVVEAAGGPVLTKGTEEQLQPEQKSLSDESLTGEDNIVGNVELELPVNRFETELDTVTAERTEKFKNKEKQETEERILEEEDWQAIFKAKKEALEKVMARNEVIQEGLSSGIFEGIVELLVLPPTSQSQIKLFQEYLVETVPHLRIVLSGGSVNMGSEIVIDLAKRVNFVGCLRQIPLVSQITRRGKKLWIKLTD